MCVLYHVVNISLSVQLEGDLSKKEERCSELQHALSMLDQEHDALRRETDSKAELVDQLEKEIRKKVGEIEESLHRVSELESEVSVLKGGRERSSEEILRLREQLAEAQRQVDQLNGQLSRAGQKGAELHQDLSTMTQVKQKFMD